MKIVSLGIGAAIGALTAMCPTLPASAAVTDVASLGAAAPTEITRFNVYLPLTHQTELDKLINDQTDSSSPRYHQWLTPAQFKQRFGPDRATVAKATSILQAAGFTVVGERTQNLIVEGSVSAVEKTFSAHLGRIQTDHGHTRLAAAERHLTLPEGLLALGAVVPEFNRHPEAHTHSQRLRPVSPEELTARTAAVNATNTASGTNADIRFSSQGFYFANDLNEAYLFPSFRATVVSPGSYHRVQLAGVGAHIGIVMSSVISPADLVAQFNSITQLRSGNQVVQAYSAVSNLPVPTVAVHLVNGGSGPFDPSTGDALEASLDTQMSLGTAPGAQETLYNMPDLSDASITAAYTDIVEDNVVDVVSSSFGGCELFYTKKYNGGVDQTSILKAYHSLFQQGNAQGITFVASSGDNGALGCNTADYIVNQAQGTSFIVGVENPADDPNVTAVGGTNLTTSAAPGPNDAQYLTENADFDPRVAEDIYFPNDPVSHNIWGSGGGISTIFRKPAYQYLVRTGTNKGRSVPDISLMMGGCPGDADLTVQDCTQLPRSAALIFIGGALYSVIGTSSSSPEFAGVLAIAIGASGGRLGNVNPLIYTLSAIQTLFGGTRAPPPLQYFHRGISGNNGFYTVEPGQAYSQVLGNSTINVKTFLGLPFAPAAGTPNSPSNP